MSQIYDLAKCVLDNSTNFAIFADDTSEKKSGKRDDLRLRTDLDFIKQVINKDIQMLKSNFRN